MYISLYYYLLMTNISGENIVKLSDALVCFVSTSQLISTGLEEVFAILSFVY